MDVLEIEREVSVNKILLDNIKNPLSEGDYEKIEEYYLALKKAGLVDLIGPYHYYDKEIFDFYFHIYDGSKSKVKKLVLKKNIVDLVLKHKIINYIVIKNHEYFSLS